VTEPSAPAADDDPPTPAETTASADALASARDTDVAAAPAAPATEDAIATLDVDGVAAVGVGTVLWAVALVLCLVLRGPLTDAGRGWWTWVCLTGALLGAAGYVYVRRRRDAYAAAHASSPA
jgi:hypothetical protein